MSHCLPIVVIHCLVGAQDDAARRDVVGDAEKTKDDAFDGRGRGSLYSRVSRVPLRCGPPGWAAFA